MLLPMVSLLLFCQARWVTHGSELRILLLFFFARIVVLSLLAPRHLDPRLA